MGFLDKLDPTGIVGAASGLVGSGISAISTAVQGKKEREFQEEENQKNRDYNAAEAEKARQFNSEEAALARDFNAEQSELARQYNTSEREAAQEWNLAQWNRENEYNSPAAQLERAKAAGLNPNSIFANGVQNNFSNGAPQTSGASSGAAAGPAATGGAASSSSTGLPTIASQIGHSLGSLATAPVEGYLKGAQASLVGKEIEWYDRKAQAGIAEQVSRIKLNGVSEEHQKLVNSFFQDAYDLNLDLLTGQVNETRARIDAIKREQDRADRLADSTIDVNESVIEANNADVDLKKSSKVGQDIDNVIQEEYKKLVQANPTLTLDQFQAMVSMDSEDWTQYIERYTDILREQHQQQRRTDWNKAAAEVVQYTVQGLVDAGLVYITKGGYLAGKIGKTGKPFQSPAVDEYNRRLSKGKIQPVSMGKGSVQNPSNFTPIGDNPWPMQ